MDRPTTDPAAGPARSPAAHGAPGGPLRAHWLGRIGYREAWDLQKRLVAARIAGRTGDLLLLLEHPAVLTLGRGAAESHVLVPPELLAARGIELLRVERGGEVTYHGPGQLVAYPIVRLADRHLGLRPFVGALEGALADTCASFGVVAGPREGHPGCWVGADGPLPRKVGALGLRVERGTTYHGIALNVSVDLADFDLIDPCGMPGLRSASVWSELGRRGEAPSTESVARAAAAFATSFAARLDADLEGSLPPDADPVRVRAALEALAGDGPVVIGTGSVVAAPSTVVAAPAAGGPA